MAPSTRTRIFFAADRVIRERGIQRMTLEEVAKVAEVSKGGLLYHFASKDALIQAMLESALDAFEKEVMRVKGDDTSPGAWLRAYIAASFPKDRSVVSEQSFIGSAVLAGVGTEPALVEPYRQHLHAWVEHASADGLEPMLAQLIRLSVDSLWMHEALGIAPYAEAEKQKMVESLAALTRVATPAVPAEKVKRRSSRTTSKT